MIGLSLQILYSNYYFLRARPQIERSFETVSVQHTYAHLQITIGAQLRADIRVIAQH